MDIAAIAALAPVVPVLTVERLADAVPLARALVKGGLPVLEITFAPRPRWRPCGHRSARCRRPWSGPGRCSTKRSSAGDRRPARASESAQAARRPGGGRPAAGLPFLPGVQTVSEAMALREQGFGLLKFFPADAAGGTAWLKAVAAPLAGLRFCPTGGIGMETAPAYLALPNVACVGGSWVAPRMPWRPATGQDRAAGRRSGRRSNEPSAPAGKLLQSGAEEFGSLYE